MIKARPVAGDARLGSAFLDGVEPYVYPPELAPAAIEDVRRTKVRLEEYIRQRGKELIEVKRGRGGIRDVEFAVQLLQIVHGRRDARLRTPNTLAALRALALEGYVADADADALAGAYRFLRRVEHRLQIVRDLQTHDLPPGRLARTTLARSLDLADADALAAEYERTTGLVRSIHERLFYRPLLESFAGPAQLHPSHGTDREATEELLGGLGFADPARAYDVLGRLVDPGRRIGKVFANLFPVMAPALALSPTPDAALVRLERIAEAVGDGRDVADLLATDPPSARRLAHLAGASSFAIDLLVADPSRILGLSDTLLGAETDAAGALVDAVARTAARELTPRESGEALSAVAVRVVREALAAAEPPGDLPFAVIGMGKLGRARAERRERPRPDVRLRGRGRRGTGSGERAGRAGAARHPRGRLGTRRRSAPGGAQRTARSLDRRLPRVLAAVRRDVGVPGAAASASRGGRPRPRPPLRAERGRRRVPARGAHDRSRGRHPPHARAHRARAREAARGGEVPLQARHRLARRRAVRGRAVADAPRRPSARRSGRAARSRRSTGSRPRSCCPARRRRDLGEAFVFHTDIKNALEMDRRLHAEAVPAAPADQTALARRLGYEEYPRQSFIDDYLRVTRRARARDGTRVLRGGHVSQRGDGRSTALVTGASSGFGAEFTRLLGADGCNVVMVARSGAAMESIAQEVEERHGVEVTVVPKDLARHGASAELVASLDQRGVTIDTLVNNAGFSTYGEFWRDDPATQSDMLAVNVVALTELSRLIVPGMVERGHGRVLHLGSVGSFSAAPMTAAYAATKAYVLSLSLAMAEELAGTGVTVTCLCPGPTRTGFQERAGMEDSALISGTQLPEAREVAEAGYAAMKAGKPYLVTGGSSRAFAFGSRFLPRTTTARIAGRSQRRV